MLKIGPKRVMEVSRMGLRKLQAVRHRWEIKVACLAVDRTEDLTENTRSRGRTVQFT